MADDIVTQLIEMGDGIKRGDGRSTVYGAASEIKRLRGELSDCNRDFDSLRVMFDNMRTQRDRLLLENGGDVSKLKKLVSELIPFMLEDVKQGLSIGVKPSDSECCSDQSEMCDDCQWYLQSEAWWKRVESGEFDWALDQIQDSQES